MHFPEFIFLTLPQPETIFWKDPTWLAAVTGIIALMVSLVISVLGFSQQRDISKRQIRSSLREQWIHDFRSDVALFVTYTSGLNATLSEEAVLARRLSDLKTTLHDNQDRIVEVKNRGAELRLKQEEFSKGAVIASYKLRTFLDVQNPVHKKMIRLMRKWKQIREDWENAIHEDDQTRQNEVLARGLKLQRQFPVVAQEIIKHEISLLIE